jgi:N-acetyl-gamma-glutamyl-phosphate reductase
MVNRETGLVLAIAALDNLGKGAAGQAVQNANLMTGQPETAGLTGLPLWP